MIAMFVEFLTTGMYNPALESLGIVPDAGIGSLIIDVFGKFWR